MGNSQCCIASTADGTSAGANQEPISKLIDANCKERVDINAALEPENTTASTAPKAEPAPEGGPDKDENGGVNQPQEEPSPDEQIAQPNDVQGEAEASTSPAETGQAPASPSEGAQESAEPEKKAAGAGKSGGVAKSEKAKKTADQLEADKKRKALADEKKKAADRKRNDLLKQAAEMLQKPGENLCRLAKGNSAKTIQRLLAAKADPNSLDDKGCFGLLEACRTGSVEVTKLLVEAKADVNKPGVLTDGGTTTLCVAAKFNHFDVVKILLEHKGDLQSKNWRGQTAMEVAGQFKKAEMVEFLMQAAGKKDDPSAAKEKGKAPPNARGATIGA